MPVVTRGERELSLRFDQFPDQARHFLEERISRIVDRLEGAVRSATPRGKTGDLRSEITSRVYTSAGRVAGYVSVYAPGGGSNPYAKAATLEYGTDKPRRSFERSQSLVSRLTGARRRIVSRISKPVHLEARRYLRGPFESSGGEIRSELNAGLEDAIAEGENT